MNQITKISCLIFFFSMSLCAAFFSSPNKVIASGYCTTAVPRFLALVVVLLIIVFAIRTTILTWITLMVLLAFAGKRRRVLVKEGRKITSDVAMSSAQIVIKDKGFVVFGFAAIVGLITMGWF